MRGYITGIIISILSCGFALYGQRWYEWDKFCDSGLAATKAEIRLPISLKYKLVDFIQSLDYAEEVSATDKLQDEPKPMTIHSPRCSELRTEIKERSGHLIKMIEAYETYVSTDLDYVDAACQSYKP